MLRIPGTDYITKRDQRIRRERQLRLERERARNQHIDIAGAPVTQCPAAAAEGAYEQPRLRRPRIRRRAPG